MIQGIGTILFGEAENSRNKQRRNNGILLGGNAFVLMTSANRIIRATTGIGQNAGAKRKVCSGYVRTFKTMYLKILQSAEKNKKLGLLTKLARSRTLRTSWKIVTTGSAILVAIGDVSKMFSTGAKIFDNCGTLPCFDKKA